MFHRSGTPSIGSPGFTLPRIRGDATARAACRSTSRWWASARGASRASGSGKGSRSWASSPTPTPTSSSAPSARSGASSASCSSCSSSAVLLARIRIARTAADPFGQFLAVGITATIGITGVPAHGGVPRADADDGPHPAVHVLRPLQPGDLAAAVPASSSTSAGCGGGRPGREKDAKRKDVAERLASSTRSSRTDAVPHRRRRHRRAPHARAGDRRGAPASGDPRSGARAGRCRARRRGRILPDPGIPLPPAAGRADLPAGNGGRTCAGRWWPAAAAAPVRRCSTPSDRWRCWAPVDTPPPRWCGWPPGAGFRPRSRSRTPIPGLPPAGSSRRVRHIYLGLPEAGRGSIRSARRPWSSIPAIRSPRPIACAGGRRRLSRSASRTGGPVVLVTGGSQGALAINQAVAGWLDAGRLARCRGALGHRTGHLSPVRRRTGRPACRCSIFSIRSPMPMRWPTWWWAGPGCMTCAELCAWGLPSILIPLPSAAADHQTHNARALADAGACLVLLPVGPDRRLAREATSALLGDTESAARRWPTRARAAASPTPRPQIVSHLLTLSGVASHFRNSHKHFTLAHPDGPFSTPRIRGLCTSWESAGRG